MKTIHVCDDKRVPILTHHLLSVVVRYQKSTHRHVNIVRFHEILSTLTPNVLRPPQVFWFVNMSVCFPFFLSFPWWWARYVDCSSLYLRYEVFNGRSGVLWADFRYQGGMWILTLRVVVAFWKKKSRVKIKSVQWPSMTIAACHVYIMSYACFKLLNLDLNVYFVIYNS